MPTPSLTLAHAQRLLVRFRNGGYTQVAICKRHHVSPSLFSYWLPKCPPVPDPQVKQRATAPVPAALRFQEVHLPPAHSPDRPCILTLPTGVRFEFPASHLRDTLALLAGKEYAC